MTLQSEREKTGQRDKEISSNLKLSMRLQSYFVEEADERASDRGDKEDGSLCGWIQQAEKNETCPDLTGESQQA